MNKVKIKRTARKVLLLLKQPASAELSILFAGDKETHKLNAHFRGINKTTDVLSFSQVESRVKRLPVRQAQRTLLPLGDIVINLEQTKRQADNYSASFYSEIYRLLIHGILHLLGYEHEKSSYKAAAMRKKEKELLNAIKKMD